MNFSWNMIENFRILAVDSYHVDPTVFIALMLLSIPFYYLGWVLIGKSVFAFRKRLQDKRNHLRVIDFFEDKKFLISLSINRAAWVMPYIYVIFWGENIPLWFWVLFIGWILLISYLFWNRLEKMVKKSAN